MTIDREELCRLCEAATPITEDMIHRYEHGGCRVMRLDPERDLITDFYTEHDRECWIAARTALPALLDALEAAEARERRLREVVAKCMDRFGEYEQGHINAGKFDKAARNGEMRQMCRDVLAETAP